jgi:hypothetical protein
LSSPNVGIKVRIQLERGPCLLIELSISSYYLINSLYIPVLEFLTLC